MVYDKVQQKLFVMANTVDGATPGADGLVQVVDFSNPAAPTFLSNIDVDAVVPEFGGINSVAVSNNVLAVAVENAVKSDHGFVAFFDATTGALLNIVEVGALPDMLVFTADGQKLLVANEGERDGASRCAGLGLADRSVERASRVRRSQTTGFRRSTDRKPTLRAQGVRITPGKRRVGRSRAGIHHDLEGRHQGVRDAAGEPTRVAEFDITGTTPVLERIVPLGYVDHSHRRQRGRLSPIATAPGTGGSSHGAIQHQPRADQGHADARRDRDLDASAAPPISPPPTKATRAATTATVARLSSRDLERLRSSVRRRGVAEERGRWPAV